MKIYKKSSVKVSKFMKGTPHGSFLLSFDDGNIFKPNNIICGRVFDFVQDVQANVINVANYDSTIRGDNPQLLDPDHAQEVDKLRKWMQDGNISHYQYDDANPAYPKAGK